MWNVWTNLEWQFKRSLKNLQRGEFVNMIEERHTKMSVSQYSPPPFCMTPRRIAFRWTRGCNVSAEIGMPGSGWNTYHHSVWWKSTASLNSVQHSQEAWATTRRVTKNQNGKGGDMHHELARTKWFGRTITIHDNHPVPSPRPHAQPFTPSHSLLMDVHRKLTGTTATWTH